MKNKFFLLISSFIVLVVLASAVAVAIINPDSFRKPFSMISAGSTLYVGRVYSAPFSNFLKLKDAHILSDLVDEEGKFVAKEAFSLKESTLWGSSVVYLNKDSILFKAPIEKCSPIDVRMRPDNECPKQNAQPAPQPQSNTGEQGPPEQ